MILPVETGWPASLRPSRVLCASYSAFMTFGARSCSDGLSGSCVFSRAPRGVWGGNRVSVPRRAVFESGRR